MAKKYKVGDAIYWFGSGSLKNKIFTGKIKELNIGRDGYGIYSRVKADAGQGMLIDETNLYHSTFKRKRK